MDTFRVFIFILFIAFVNCQQSQEGSPDETEKIPVQVAMSNKAGGALLLQDFKSLSELKSVIAITYASDQSILERELNKVSKVSLAYNNRGRQMISTLAPGVSETDFQNARKGSFLVKLKLALVSPYTVMNKSDLERIEMLSRRRDHIYGEGDVAFYDLAETMVKNISEDDKVCMDSALLSEKGYLNTFNHVIAQTFMTAIFSEELADFVGDVHERSRIPELITGIFTAEQLADLNDGPVDNYIDMINNDWGQELGKELRKKYDIGRKTVWTPGLLANYLNDIQSYHAWVFQIGFEPFKSNSEIVSRFSNKINSVMTEMARLRKLK